MQSRRSSQDSQRDSSRETPRTSEIATNQSLSEPMSWGYPEVLARVESTRAVLDAAIDSVQEKIDVQEKQLENAKNREIEYDIMVRSLEKEIADSNERHEKAQIIMQQMAGALERVEERASLIKSELKDLRLRLDLAKQNQKKY